MVQIGIDEFYLFVIVCILLFNVFFPIVVVLGVVVAAGIFPPFLITQYLKIKIYPYVV
jgi:hypothetical protein